MNITLSIQVGNAADAEKLGSILAAFETGVTKGGGTEVTLRKKGATKKAAAETLDTDEDESDFDLETSATTDTDLEDDAEEETETKYTVKDVIHALGTYAKKHGDKGRERAQKLLAKYGVKNVNKLDPKHFGDVITAVSK